MVTFRPATPLDAHRIAALHADSWRRHYRGAYSDAYLDGDVVTDRRTVWSARLATPGPTGTVLAEQDGHLIGFVHVVLDDDPHWGSLVDNLHVTHDHHGAGVGTRLLAHAARAAATRASSRALYLWVLEQNVAAQHFYRARGATCTETVPVTGDPGRLSGTPRKLRMTWPDATSLTGTE